MLAPWKKSYDKPRQRIKKQRHYFADKGPYSQSYGFSSIPVWTWELDHKEGWVPKNWGFQTLVLRVPGQQEDQTRNQPWIFIGRMNAEAETLILWPPDVESWFTGKDLDAGKHWRQDEKEATEDKIVGWHHWPNGLEFEQIPGGSEGQGSLACCSPWGCKEMDMTQWLNNNERVGWILSVFVSFVPVT